MAANTSYNDFPRVLFLMARDRQAPRSFLRIGDRLTFRNGILLLSLTSAAIYIVFRGNTESLLPLYAVGVFLAFTLSQTGMIMHWRRHRDQPHWRRSLVFNATGAVLSGIVFIIEGVTKFTAGAWVAIVLIGAITVTALRTRRYYVLTGQQLTLHAEEAATPAALPAKVAPRPPSSRPARGPKGAAAPGSEAEGAEQPGQINALTIVPVEVMDRPASRRWRTLPHSASPRSRCTSAPPPRRLTGSLATGGHGETTCRSRSSSRRTAPWSPVQLNERPVDLDNHAP